MTEIALVLMIPFVMVSVIALLIIFAIRSATRRAFNGVRYPHPLQGGGYRRDGSPSSPFDAFFADSTYGNGGHAHPRHENGHHDQGFSFDHGSSHHHGHSHGHSHDHGSSFGYDSGSSGYDSGSSSSDSGSSSSSSCD
ncbi:hypothetical protein [Actinocorallia longicatena]|uniref:Uncharacterized protein n=1 Tax=Actinocorallia longicatena TaxID=111803 RepID=A0ABP6Q5D9_9ACTN